jgi:hypothetical protein
VQPPKKRNLKKLILTIVGVVVAAALIWAAVAGYRMFVGNPIESNKYQAVFLTNGQVYFGKLHRTGGDYYKLNDVFYLQASQSKTDATDANNPQKASSDSSGVQLIKLGNEVHGPEDSMIIDKSQVLFFENLKNDGKVVDSINKYKTEKK